MPIPTVPRFEDPSFAVDAPDPSAARIWGTAPKLNFDSTDGNLLVFNQSGQMILASKLESLEQLIVKALITDRLQTPNYDVNFGSDFWTLMGRGYNELITQSLAERYVRQALGGIALILSVDQIVSTVQDGTLYLHFRVNTDSGYKNFDFERTIA
jgi:phage gp46-like protein